ncbi:MAG: beta-ketoacyl-[acyl-carrier-protein] synthase family protein [Candidatus Omnitrophica bacterium]|nr:beta-ketoacyl-[acyl-carrier-protein] synthase family protein [Candidatus Omnitrophota bacterium]
MSGRRVVITGIGTVSACGLGYEPLWQAAVKGESAIRPLSEFSTNGSPVRVGGEIPDFEAADFVKERKSLKVMSRDIRLAVAASTLAVRDAGLVVESMDATRAGVTLGAPLINNELDELGLGIRGALDSEKRFQIKRFGREGIRALYPLWLLKYLPNMPACHISMTHRLKGPNNTLMTSSTGGLQAIGEAFRTIQRDDADVMLAGATDSKLNPVGLARLHLLGILSTNGHEPRRAYRPFDRRRDGMVVGEGAGIFVLEEQGHASRRGARIYGEILGYGTNFNREGQSVKKALEEAGRGADEIDFVHAHGSGVREEDISEAKLIAGIFQNSSRRVPVTATKSVTGHLIDASGMTEASLALLALDRNLIPPVVNLEEPDPECDLNFVTGAPRPVAARTFLVHGMGLGEQSAAVVVGRHEK